MKKIIFAALVLLGFTSCDPCNKITCYNAGTCEDGICECSNGYEGEQCNVITANKYVGTWYGTATDGTYSSALNWVITRGKEINYLVVENSFILTFEGEKLTLLGAIDPELGTTYSGNGTISENKISLNLQVFDGSESYAFTYALSK